MVDYDAFAEALRAIDKQQDVLATIWQGEQRALSSLGNQCMAVLMVCHDQQTGNGSPRKRQAY